RSLTGAFSRHGERPGLLSEPGGFRVAAVTVMATSTALVRIWLSNGNQGISWSADALVWSNGSQRRTGSVLRMPCLR
ncbi:hypothetical protein, partial [Phytoactinopolyspora endophytica]|uniref:hypothetical protein n=1 Tax=Phytoactinopolyspora endophytica TaxID=1642495 RepID=UPI00197C5D30